MNYIYSLLQMTKGDIKCGVHVINAFKKEHKIMAAQL